MFLDADCTPPFLIDVYTDTADDDGDGGNANTMNTARSQGIISKLSLMVYLAKTTKNLNCFRCMYHLGAVALLDSWTQEDSQLFVIHIIYVFG